MSPVRTLSKITKEGEFYLSTAHRGKHSVRTGDCLECHAEFQLFGAGRMPKYCNDACKMKAYRKRKKAARFIVAPKPHPQKAIADLFA